MLFFHFFVLTYKIIFIFQKNFGVRTRFPSTVMSQSHPNPYYLNNSWSVSQNLSLYVEVRVSNTGGSSEKKLHRVGKLKPKPRYTTKYTDPTGSIFPVFTLTVNTETNQAQSYVLAEKYFSDFNKYPNFNIRTNSYATYQNAKMAAGGHWLKGILKNSDNVAATPNTSPASSQNSNDNINNNTQSQRSNNNSHPNNTSSSINQQTVPTNNTNNNNHPCSTHSTLQPPSLPSNIPNLPSTPVKNIHQSIQSSFHSPPIQQTQSQTFSPGMDYQSLSQPHTVNQQHFSPASESKASSGQLRINEL